MALQTTLPCIMQARNGWCYTGIPNADQVNRAVKVMACMHFKWVLDDILNHSCDRFLLKRLIFWVKPRRVI